MRTQLCPMWQGFPLQTDCRHGKGCLGAVAPGFCVDRSRRVTKTGSDGFGWGGIRCHNTQTDSDTLAHPHTCNRVIRGEEIISYSITSDFPLHRGSPSFPGFLWMWYSLCFTTGFMAIYLCMRGCISEQCKNWLQMEYITFFLLMLCVGYRILWKKSTKCISFFFLPYQLVKNEKYELKLFELI